MHPAPDRRTTVRAAARVDVRLTLAPLRRGSGDPHLRYADGGIWHATRTPAGPATVRVAPGVDGVDVAAWGLGAEWAVAQAPDLLGARDHHDGWDGGHPLVRDLHRRHPGVRLLRTERVLEALVPAVLEQKVTGHEAWGAWRDLLRRFGEAAPGPGAALGLRVPPAAATIAAVPSWEWHRMNVDEKRAATVRRCANVAGRLEETVTMPVADACRRLGALPGVGPWTTAEVASRAYGDADAVSVGDFHLPHLVGWALAGVPRSTDEEMLALLEPFRPYRQRVVRLLELSGLRAPRFGPRLAPRDIRAI